MVTLLRIREALAEDRSELSFAWLTSEYFKERLHVHSKTAKSSIAWLVTVGVLDPRATDAGHTIKADIVRLRRALNL
jgi:hypothetical protein